MNFLSVGETIYRLCQKRQFKIEMHERLSEQYLKLCNLYMRRLRYTERIANIEIDIRNQEDLQQQDALKVLGKVLITAKQTLTKSYTKTLAYLRSFGTLVPDVLINYDENVLNLKSDRPMSEVYIYTIIIYN